MRALLRTRLRPTRCWTFPPELGAPWPHTKQTTVRKFGHLSISSVESAGETHTQVLWNDGHVSTFNNTWLRDHCQCSQCVHPHSHQRTFDSLDVATAQNHVEEHTLSEGNQDIQILWASDSPGTKDMCHRSFFSAAWLRQQCYTNTERETRLANEATCLRRAWSPEQLLERCSGGIPTVEYAALMCSDEEDAGLKSLLTNLYSHGIVFVNNCPLSMDETENIVKRFGTPRYTPTWGTMWDTAPAEKPQDTAYTNIALLPHVDCCYLEDQVGFQVFNCVDAAAKNGGASVWVDGFKVAENMRANHPEAYDYFCTVSLPYFCVTDDAHVRSEGRIFEQGHDGMIRRVKFNNYDRAPLNSLTSKEIDQFYEHLPVLYKAFRDPKNILQHTLHVGQMVIIDNWRVLHGREEFQGYRNLRGCYVGRDDVWSKMHWEIAHCNDANRMPQQYAQVQSNGALECVDCPHPVGANCQTTDAQWKDVFANKEWWTSGRKKTNSSNDVNFYKCPFKGACLGGNATITRKNGTVRIDTTKSRCETGFTGIVCAVCDKGFYLLDDSCWVCLPSDGSAEFVVTSAMVGTMCMFVGALLIQLRVRDSKSHWKALRKASINGLHQHRASDESTAAESRTHLAQNPGHALKTFIGYVQVLSVANSAFKIPWPSGFLYFLRGLVPFNFDFLSVSGIGCLVEYKFYHSFLGMAVLPLFVLALVYATYKINLARQEAMLKETFTHAMRVSYANRAVQFTLWSILLIYPPLSRRVTEYFACSEKIEGKYYLVKDYRVECYEGDWNDFLVLAMAAIVVYPVGIPAYFAYRLWKNRDQLENDIVLARFGFLYEAYRPKRYLWDVFELLRKFVLTGIIVIMWPGEPFQIIIAVLVNTMCLVYLLVERPHKAGPDRTMARLSYIALTMTMLLGLILNTVKDASKYDWFFDALLVGSNGMVVGYAFKVVVWPKCQRVVATKSGDVKVVPRHLTKRESVELLCSPQVNKSTERRAAAAWASD